MSSGRKGETVIAHLARNAAICLPTEAYRKYRGQWIALSADGTSIIASADNLRTLEERLVANGEDPEKVIFDRVEGDDGVLGGAEFL
ncbi:MAG: hypothetical protein H8E44_43125 [Planctomycetes bacterium]|nr:hypothetical protein [Planctomycetota bacterium]